MAHHYIAQFLPQEDGTFCVFFPDLEGCNTFGDTLQEAFEAAQDAACLLYTSPSPRDCS